MGSGALGSPRLLDAAPRARRGVGRALVDLTITCAVLALIALVAWLPYRALRAAARPLAWLAASYRRAHVERALARAGLPLTFGPRVIRSLATGLLEVAWSLARSPSAVVERVTLTARAARALELARGGGAVVATAHTGNWDLVACAAAHHAPLSVVTKRLSNAPLDRLWMRARARHGIELVSEGVVARCLAALRGGRVVALLVDQRPSSARVVRHAFLGAPADSDPMPAVLARRAGRPLIVALGHRLPNGTHVIDVPRVFEEVVDVDATTRAISDEVDAFVRAHPDAWLWTHRRWAA